jgi:hypothetical protein
MLNFAIFYYLSKAAKLPKSFRGRYIKKPIFIVGPQRSGTSFLQNIISNADEVHNWSEANYVWEPYYYDFTSLYKVKTKDWFPGFIGKTIHAHKITPESLDKTRKRVKKLFSIRCFINQKRRLLHKNPFNSVRLRELLEIFPDAKIINSYRKPKPAVNSSLNKSYQGYVSREKFIKKAVYRWYVCNENFKKIKEKYPNQTMEVQYSDLGSSRSEKILSNIFEFSDLEINKKVLSKLRNFRNMNYKFEQSLSTNEKQLVDNEIEKLDRCK